MDKIIITGLTVETIIGVNNWERQVNQKVVLDLELSTDIRPAANSDNLENTIDYAAMTEQVMEFIAKTQFLLIETLAEKTAEFILKNFQIQKINLTLSKPGAIPNATNVMVNIERTKMVL